MICKYCGGVFRRENLQYCPYCDMEIPIDEQTKTTQKAEQSETTQKTEQKKWNPDKLTEIRTTAPYSDGPHGTVKVTVQGNAALTSPATGANYVMEFDDGVYQVRVSKDDMDTSESIELPVGRHDAVLRYYTWNDTEFKNPETNRNDRLTIEVREYQTTEILIKTGTLFKSRAIEVRYDD